MRPRWLLIGPLLSAPFTTILAADASFWPSSSVEPPPRHATICSAALAPGCFPSRWEDCLLPTSYACSARGVLPEMSPEPPPPPASDPRDELCRNAVPEIGSAARRELPVPAHATPAEAVPAMGCDEPHIAVRTTPSGVEFTVDPCWEIDVVDRAPPALKTVVALRRSDDWTSRIVLLDGSDVVSVIDPQASVERVEWDPTGQHLLVNLLGFKESDSDGNRRVELWRASGEKLWSYETGGFYRFTTDGTAIWLDRHPGCCGCSVPFGTIILGLDGQLTRVWWKVGPASRAESEPFEIAAVLGDGGTIALATSRSVVLVADEEGQIRRHWVQHDESVHRLRVSAHPRSVLEVANSDGRISYVNQRGKLLASLDLGMLQRLDPLRCERSGRAVRLRTWIDAGRQEVLIYDDRSPRYVLDLRRGSLTVADPMLPFRPPRFPAASFSWASSVTEFERDGHHRLSWSSLP